MHRACEIGELAGTRASFWEYVCVYGECGSGGWAEDTACSGQSRCGPESTDRILEADGRTIKMRGCCRGKRYGIFKPSIASGADAAVGPAGERKGTDGQSAVRCCAGPGDVQSLFGI